MDLQRLLQGVSLDYLFQNIVIALQSEVGVRPVQFGTIRETNTKGTVRIAVEFDDEAVGLACVDRAFEMLMAAVDRKEYDFETILEELKSFAYDEALGPSTRSIVDAAKRRNIPWRRLNSGSLIQFGYGCNKGYLHGTGCVRLIRLQEKDKQIDAISVEGRRSPSTRRTSGCQCRRCLGSHERDWCPCRREASVWKPWSRCCDQSLHTRAGCGAYESAREQGDAIVVEKFAPGDDYRLLVVGGKLVAAARREPAHVIGDGLHTVSQLVELVNQIRDAAKGMLPC